MASEEGQKVFNEVLFVLEGTDLDYSLLQLKNENHTGAGYTIEIKAFLGMTRKQQIGKIAEKHKLLLSESPEGLTLVKNN
jgi:hypothetical protein